MNDKDMVSTYFATLALYKNATNNEDDMNLTLLQRPRRIKPGTKTLYIYAPSIVTSGLGLEPGSVVRILDVYNADNYDECSLRVVEESAWRDHRYTEQCFRYEKYNLAKEQCACMLKTEEMPPYLRNSTYHVLLSDIGK